MLQALLEKVRRWVVKVIRKEPVYRVALQVTQIVVLLQESEVMEHLIWVDVL